MAIFSNNAQNNGSVNSNAGGSTKRPSAKVWLNFGYRTKDPETGEMIFIGLPMGIPVDTQEKRSAGNSMLMQAKNAFLDKLVEDSADMEPGAEVYLDVDGGYCLQLRRVAERDEPTADNNPFIAAVSGLSGFAAK